MNLTLNYFASLRDQAGCASETVVTADDTDLITLYEGLRQRHGFSLPRDRLRVAIDGAFASWDAALREGAEVVFIPPVSGG